MDQLGVTNLQHFILELKEKDGRGSNRAVISFNEPRRGMASWLAAPGPMGALEFISPDANMVAAFVVKDPVALVDDLLGALQTIDPALGQHLATFERENNLNVRRDFAAPLGGEFAFAVDGPVLPSPSWKMIFEVNDTARLQQTFEQIVERLNALSAREGRRGFQWERAEGTGGRMFYTLKSVDFGLEVSYAYMNGYLVMTPNRALLDRAMRYHDSQVTLVSSPKFTAALPPTATPISRRSFTTTSRRSCSRSPARGRRPQAAPPAATSVRCFRRSLPLRRRSPTLTRKAIKSFSRPTQIKARSVSIRRVSWARPDHSDCNTSSMKPPVGVNRRSNDGIIRLWPVRKIRSNIVANSSFV
ncbi:MAG: hypothetical protein WKF30_11895 [Pyrinomonadaceae bacterium]